MRSIAEVQGSWALMEILLAFHKLRVWDYLNHRAEATSVGEIAKNCGLIYGEQLEAGLLYVSIVWPDFLTREKNGDYTLSRSFNDKMVQNTLYFSQAYAPVVRNIQSLLDGSKQYGVGVNRDGEMLGISSAYYSAAVTEQLAVLIGKDTPDQIVDLGCGAGEVLNRLTTALGCRGYGVDLNERPNNLNDHCQYIVGDVATPDEWSHLIQNGRSILIACFVLHEFLNQDSKTLENIIRQYRERFSGSYLYIVEYNSHDPNSLNKLPSPQKESSAFYQFVHPFTGQGSPLSVEGWRTLLKEIRLELCSVYATHTNATIYKIKL